MNVNLAQEVIEHESEILFGMPSVAWDSSAGCASIGEEKRGPIISKVTTKQNKAKHSYSTSIYRRRQLLSQKNPLDDDVEGFTAQLSSLIKFKRKSGLKSPADISPKNRSPRRLRQKSSINSPCRLDQVELLLDDSIENEALIRCSQAIEEAFNAETTPVAARKENRLSSTKKSIGKSSGAQSPLARSGRKLLLNGRSPRSPKSDISPLRPVAQVPQMVTPPPIKPIPTKSSDQVNNNVRTSFGMSEDDDLFFNLPDDCTKSDPSKRPKRSPRLSLLSKHQASTAVEAVKAADEDRGPEASSTASIKRLSNATSTITAVGKVVEKACTEKPEAVQHTETIDILDDLDDFDLSPALLDLLDGNIKGEHAVGTSSSRSETLPRNSKEIATNLKQTTSSSRTTVSRSVLPQDKTHQQKSAQFQKRTPQLSTSANAAQQPYKHVQGNTLRTFSEPGQNRTAQTSSLPPQGRTSLSSMPDPTRASKISSLLPQGEISPSSVPDPTRAAKISSVPPQGKTSLSSMPDQTRTAKISSLPPQAKTSQSSMSDKTRTAQITTLALQGKTSQSSMPDKGQIPSLALQGSLPDQTKTAQTSSLPPPGKTSQSSIPNQNRTAQTSSVPLQGKVSRTSSMPIPMPIQPKTAQSSSSVPPQEKTSLPAQVKLAQSSSMPQKTSKLHQPLPASARDPKNAIWRCTPEEIEKKRQEALKKLKRHATRP